MLSLGHTDFRVSEGGDRRRPDLSPSVQDWERPLFHGKFSLSGQPFSSIPIMGAYLLHPNVAETLLGSCPTPSFLPNIRELEYPSFFYLRRCSAVLMFKLSNPAMG
ncbi:hypothetical protein JVU11DRAFT_3379 [Chiua virens]|nr:hypothetical protein JVU11DRAFT_3379 [Chiua virens]